MTQTNNDPTDAIPSLATTPAASLPPSGTTTRFTTPAPTTSSSIPENAGLILTQLGISAHVADCSDHGLHIAYQKYRAHLEACHTYERKIADGTWSGARLTAIDLVSLFVPKSFYHSHYKKILGRVSDHPLMVEWLGNGLEDRPANIDVWGYEKANYSWQDLKDYLKEKDKKGKGKGKKKEDNNVGGSGKNTDHKKKSGNKKQVN